MSKPFLSRNAITFLMRRHAVTIRELYQKMDLTTRRVRRVHARRFRSHRRTGLDRGHHRP